MIARRLTDNGMGRFAQFLDSLSGERPMEYPDALLEDDEVAPVVERRIEVEAREFADRFAAARYLDERFGSVPAVEYDKGLWAWLALFYFGQICKVGRDGEHRPGEIARWIPENDNYRKYYRHLLRGPFSIYRLHREDPARAMALLCGPVTEPGDVVEQLAARQELITNATVIKTATALYYDPDKRILRRGAAGRGPGSARRFADLLNQLDVTWDLYGMREDDLVKLLPSEFTRFRSSIAASR
jgi:hypothetical protein